MKKLRLLLYPLSIIYGLVTWCRNWCYNVGIFQTSRFDIPIIAVGNLSVGGTGKTPQIEYLIRLLSQKYQVAVLSRGYKRTSKGFILANSSSTAATLGDEPYQYFCKFKKIQVAVDANRKNGIQHLLQLFPQPQIILLDDAFQHRKVTAGKYILLTTYNDLYCDDYLLPAGNLREQVSNAHRANIIIVTKCPENLSLLERIKIGEKLNLTTLQTLYFTYVTYHDKVIGLNDTIAMIALFQEPKTIVAGIAKPQSFIQYVKNKNDTVLVYPDHHTFSDHDIKIISQKSAGKKIITTEKDYVRLKDSILKDKIYYLGIKNEFIADADAFDQEILNYVVT